MKIAILHLSDLHLKIKNNLSSKIESLKDVSNTETHDVSFLFLVISGDICFSGKKEEYEQAIDILNSIKEQHEGKIKIIMVPGNHDCNFDNENQLRKNTIHSVDYDVIGEDNSVLNNCLKVQDDFWEFHHNYNSIPTSKLFHTIDHVIERKKIRFNCINSAWMSAYEEMPGSLFFPVKNIPLESNDVDISISVIHHPLNWFTPESEENNKREVEQFLLKISDIQLIGHEHLSGFTGNRDLEKDIESLQFCGNLFHDPKAINKSGFQFVKIDLKSKKGEIISYKFDSKIYTEISRIDFDYLQSKDKDFNISTQFFKFINKIPIPLSENGAKLRLSDIFIYPHLDQIGIKQTYIDSFIDAKDILNSKRYNNIVLSGDSQIGKSSLLKTYCSDYYTKNIYPILINGREIKDADLKKLLKKKFKKTYKVEENNFEHFFQFDKNRKVVLIDDFQDNKLNAKQIRKFIKSLCHIFGTVIIVIDSMGDVFTQLKNDFDDFKIFSIKPLGYKKTNDLIVKYQSQLQNPLTVEKQVFLNEVKYKFDQVCSVLGNKIVPSYPIFLLSILQSLASASFDLKNTSYGYCYQSLIHFALSNKAKIVNDDIDSYFNFLKFFAYHLYENDIDSIDEDGFIDFYSKYKKDFHIFDYSYVKKKLLSSQILLEEEMDIRFGYKYILLFLAAQHISDILNTEKGKSVLSELFENIHVEKNANILVFITHHTKDLSFMNDSLFHAMIPFETISPITLEKDDPFYAHIGDISKSISNEVIEQKESPEVERDNSLIALDSNERTLEKESDKLNIPKEVEDAIIPFKKSYASIDIVGQIIKNRKGSLEKKKIVELVAEVYLTGFRTIGSVGDLFTEITDILITESSKKIKSKDLKNDIESKTLSLMQLLSIHSCLGVFSKISGSVGMRNFQDVYDDVADKIGTAAARLVSFTINSYYNDLTIEELKSLVKIVKDNPVAMFIIRERVKSYIYLNHVDSATKQSFAQILDMRFTSKLLGKPKPM